MAPLLHQHPSTAPAPTGPPLLLIHGLGGDRHSWRPVLEGLRPERDVLVAELPGFGGAPALPEDVEPSPAALAAALADELERMEIGPVHAVGVSLGGWVALELADQGHAASVVALAPAGFWPQPLAASNGLLMRVGRATRPVLPLLLRIPELRNRVLVSALGGPGGFSYADGSALVQGYVRATDFARVNAAMRARTFDWSSRLATVSERVPVHVLWGGRDPLVQAPRRALPETVTVHRLPEAGHMPMFDDPEAITRLLLDVSGSVVASSTPSESP